MPQQELAVDIGLPARPDPTHHDGGGPSEAQALSDALIMLVDDEPTTTDIVQMYLEDAGYHRFVTTSDSVDALGLAQKAHPDVLLLDLMMPEVSGFDILGAMRADEELAHIPVIVLTSSTDAETKLRALELGATDFLAKPVDSSELVLRLRNTLSAKAYQDRLAYYDNVTGLPNRRLFMQRLERSLERAKQSGKRALILHIGLDRFKQINDTLGHTTGDVLLKMVGRRIEQCVRTTDVITRSSSTRGSSSGTLSRIGGDEFTILLLDIEGTDAVTPMVRRLLDSLGDPFRLQGEDLFLTASIGIVVSPDDGEDVETLLKHAGIAMSHAKQRGRNTYQFYSESLNAQSMRRLSLENALRKALENEELVLHYQPQVDAAHRVTGAEALLRWNHPELGMIAPGEFIPIAEDTGLIVPIGDWVLQAACAQAHAWESAGLGRLRMSVNVSSRQFQDSRLLVESIRAAIERSGLSGESLVVELTESLLMVRPEKNVGALEAMKEMGLKLSIDDFGTGYSSLSYLKRFPLDELKVDQSFVRDVPADTDGAAIVSAIIAMAHSLDLTVVAEGVETAAQLDFLKSRSCDEYQGYLFSRPVTADALADLLGDSDELSPG